MSASPSQCDPTNCMLNTRRGAGSLVLGQDQECFGGCFSPQYQLHGDLAVLRIWDRALRQVCVP